MKRGGKVPWHLCAFVEVRVSENPTAPCGIFQGQPPVAKSSLVIAGKISVSGDAKQI